MQSAEAEARSTHMAMVHVTRTSGDVEGEAALLRRRGVSERLESHEDPGHRAGPHLEDVLPPALLPRHDVPPPAGQVAVEPARARVVPALHAVPELVHAPQRALLQHGEHRQVHVQQVVVVREGSPTCLPSVSSSLGPCTSAFRYRRVGSSVPALVYSYMVM